MSASSVLHIQFIIGRSAEENNRWRPSLKIYQVFTGHRSLKNRLRHQAPLWMWNNRLICSDYKAISTQCDDFT